MAVITLKFHVSDKLLPVIDSVGDGVSRDDFFRKALEYGTAELVQAALRMNNDFLTHTLTGQTKDYRQARALFRIDDPEKASPAAEVADRRFSVAG